MSTSATHNKLCPFSFFQHEADSSDMLHEVAADFVCNSLYTSEVCV